MEVVNPFDLDNSEKQSEFKLHLAIKKHYESCFIGAHNPNLKIMHIANENRNSTQGYFNKMLGVEKGFVDILAAWPKGVGVCEVKLPGKPLTSDQNRFLSWARLVGWHTGVARTKQQFHDFMLSCGLKASHNCTGEVDYRSDTKKMADAFDFFAP